MRASFFGDSHINLLKLIDPAVMVGDTAYILREHIARIEDDELRIRYFASASATGLSNEKSTLGVNKHVRDYINLDLIDSVENFIFHFGKVDLDFGLPYKSFKRGSLVDIDDFIAKTVTSYINFLLDLRRSLGKEIKIFILGITPPPLDVEQMTIWVNNEAIMNDVSEKNGSEELQVKQSGIHDLVRSKKFRTNLCERYNTILSEKAVENGFGFIDLFTPSVDQKTGLLDTLYNYGTDHHANPQTMSKLIYDEVKKAI